MTNNSNSYHNDETHVVNNAQDSSADDYDVKQVQQRTAEAMKQMQALVESANATMGISSSPPKEEQPSSNNGQLKSYGSIHPDQTFVVSDELDGFISSQTKPKSCLTRMAELLGL